MFLISVQSKKNDADEATFSQFRASNQKRFNMYRKYLFAIVIIFAVFSCSYDTLDGNANLVIKNGTVCGWCSMNDTLTISETYVEYVDYKNCSTTNPAVSKTGELTATELNDLLGKLDFEQLKKLELNSCNVCADGCDDWISYKKGSQTHTIRFSRNDPRLQPIKAFVDQLNVIKSRYSSAN